MYKTQRNYENAQKMLFEGVGQFGIPPIKPVEFDNAEFVGFNYAKSTKEPGSKAVHFFLDDYQFLRVWNKPDRYIDMLSKFRYVLSPDFSIYTDYPKALQIYNHYRKHWVGAYLQESGANVIPTIAWSTPDSFEWCFDGEPKGGCVAVSSVGCMNSSKSKELFMLGYQEMVKRLEPTQIIFYGRVPDECRGNIIHIKEFSEKWHEPEIKHIVRKTDGR